MDDLSLLLTPQQLHACDPLRLVPTPAGGLILENADTGSKKVVRLKTPVVGGFNIFEVNPSNPGIVRGRYHLHRVFPLGSSETTAEPDDKVTALEHAFIGSHNGSLYALSSAHFAPEIPETVEEPVVIAEPVGGDDEQPNNSNSLSSIAPDGSVIGCVPSSENYPACLVGLRLPVLDPPPLVPPTLPPNDTGAAQPARDTAVATESPTVAQPARFSILRILWIGTGLVLVAAAGAAALYLYLQSQGVSAGTGESNGGFISVNTKRKRGSRGSGKGNKEQQGKETANDLQSDPPAILADADQSEKAEPGLKDKENGKVDGNSAPNDSPTEDAEGADVKDGEEAANGNATPKMGPKRKRKPHSAKRKEQEQTPRPASNVPAPSEKPVTLQPEAPARPVSPAPAPAPDKPLPRVPGLPESASPKMIQVTPQILGYGSHGTVVYKGSFQGRECAVKRLLLDFYDVADHEVNLLRESDDHPNVIRYFAREQCDRFMYIALELCPASVYDIVERANVPEFRELRKVLTPPQVVYQMMLGIAYLHRLKVVHRDIKPQNILITQGRPTQPPRVVISDFGLGKKLEDNQSSFNNTMHTAAGTVGWRAPECMPHPSNLSDSGQPSDSTPGDSHSSSKEFGSGVRITKAVDIFSAGCVFYYIVSGGEHPFGDRYEREVNILRGNYRLDKLVGMGEEGVEAADLIAAMIARNYKERPSAADILTHPYFWTPAQRLTFLMDASDRFEIEVRDPPSPLLQKLEGGARDIVGVDWHKRLDKGVIENLGKHRKYDGVLIRDLLRALRNKVGWWIRAYLVSA